jgi:hypothetical protein
MFHQFDHRWATFGGLEVGKLGGWEDEEPTNLETYEPTDLEDDEEEGEGGGDKAKTRDCTLAEKQDPTFLPTPRYWVSEADVLMRAVPLTREEKKELEAMDPERVVARLRPRAPKWLIAFRDIARSTDERTAIFSVLPLVGCGNNAPVLHLGVTPEMEAFLPTVMSSIVTDYMTRCKLGGTHLNAFYLYQCACLAPDQLPTGPTRDRLAQIQLELVYTSEHLRPLAEEVCRSLGWEVCRSFGWEFGKSGAEEPTNLPTSQPINLDPFPYDEDRRALLRAELDALVARLYGLNRKQLRYILCPQGLSWAELENINDGWEDPTCSGPHLLPAEPALNFPGETFRVLKEKEERKYGEYRTRRLVLEAWDRLWKELGPVEPLPVRFGGLEVDQFDKEDPTNLPTYQPTDLAPLVATGLFAEDSPSPRPGERGLGGEGLGAAAARPQPASIRVPSPLPPSFVDDEEEEGEEEEEGFALVAPEPKPPTPLKDKQGNIIRVRVIGASGQEIVAAGTVVGQRKQGEAVEWAVLVDVTNAVRKFLSPPATLKRLKDPTDEPEP